MLPSSLSATDFPDPLPSAGLPVPAFSPLYQQIKGLILQSLQAGEMEAWRIHPQRNGLAARFKVSQGTVRKAIDELAAENLVTRRQGKGTFVSTHAEQHVQYRFLKLMPDSGDASVEARPSALSSTASACAPAPRLPALGLRTGDPMMQVRRILSFSGIPTILEDIWLPGQAFRA